MNSNKQPWISVIVLNWNGKECLPRCLDALSCQTFDDFEVIVVDNASTDYSADDVEECWPGFRVLRLKENSGFSKGNNSGAQIASGRWLAVLNNDAFPASDWLEKLVEAAQQHPEFSFFASRLVRAREEGLVESTGDIYNISGLAWPRDHYQPEETVHLQPDEVFSPCAAAAMYDRQAYLAVQGFDEDFVSHHEDVDLGFRLRLQGARCLYVPEAVVSHVGSASYGATSDRTVYQVQRNLIWCYVSNMPGWLFWKYLPAHLFANLVFLLYYSFGGQARAVWKAKWDALRGLPTALRKRRVVQQQRKIEPNEFDRVLDHGCFTPYTLGKRGRKIRNFLKILRLAIFI